MDLLILIIAISYGVTKYLKKNEGGSKREKRSAQVGPTTEEWSQKIEQMKRTAGNAVNRTVERTEHSFSGRRAEAEQTRRNAAERRHSERQWAEARAKQADALLVHSAGVDSCEGRLESLKVLYDAGILDREEYLQRVARVKSAHSHR